MSRAHPHYFPHDTPEPVAQPYSAINELMQLIEVWLAFAAVCAVLAVSIAFFCPSLLILLN